MWLARFAAQRKDGRVVGERHRSAPQRRVAQEDELPRRQLELFPADGEPHAAADDEVDLLVAKVRLGMLLDDLPPGLGRRVDVDAEGADVEVPAHRPPDEPVRQLDRVQFVEMGPAHSSA